MRDLVGISEKWGRTGIEECSEGIGLVENNLSVG